MRRLRRRFDCCLAKPCGVPRQQSLERIAQVVQQPPAVSHLQRRRRSACGRIGIGSGAVARNQSKVALLGQPSADGGDITISEQRDRPVVLQIDHDHRRPLPPMHIVTVTMPDLMYYLLPSGQAREVRQLDLAMLCDIGMTTTRCAAHVPAPGTAALVLGGLWASRLVRHRQPRAQAVERGLVGKAW